MFSKLFLYVLGYCQIFMLNIVHKMFNEINITVEHFAKLLNGTKYLYRKRMHIAKFRSLVTPPLREHIAKKTLFP